MYIQNINGNKRKKKLNLVPRWCVVVITGDTSVWKSLPGLGNTTPSPRTTENFFDPQEMDPQDPPRDHNAQLGR
jgi:hypothetical protein